MRRAAALGITLVMTATLAACGDDDDSGSGSGDGDSGYKIGFVASLSGAGSVFADQGIQSAELAIEELKDQGIVEGDIELVKVDDAGDPATSQQVCSRLVLEEKVDAIVGFQNSANREGCLPVATRAKVPYLYATPYEGGECADNFNVLGEVPKQQVDPIIQYMIESEGAQKWYLTGSDYVAMTAGNQYAQGVIEELGGEVVEEQYAPLNSTDFAPIISSILGSGADTAFVNFLGTDFIAFLKAWQTTPGTEGVKLATFGIPIGGGDAVENLYTAFSYFPSIDNEANQTYKDGLDEMFGDDAQIPSILSVVNYDAVWMWGLAVQEAGSADYDGVNKAIREVTFDGPRGPIEFNDEGHATLPMYVATLNGDPLAGGETILEEVPPTDPGEQCS
jgi:branched-chain amino acid transport system substrate-binding protein